MRPQNFATAEKLQPLCAWHRKSPWNESSECLTAERAPCCEGSAEELAAHLAVLADDPARTDVGEGGRDWVRRHADLSAVARRYERLLRRVAGR